MNLKLNKPLCFFDLETTGINIVKDRIVEIAVLKVSPTNKKNLKSWLVNPEINIPEEAISVHGITNEMVKNKPTFKLISKEVFEFIKNCDLAGFNSDRFDIPLLVEEFMRSEINFDLSKVKTIDVQTIFHKMEKRTLGAAYKFYCDKTLIDAHSAKSDSMATFEVLLSQISKYKDLGQTVKDISEFSTRKNIIDFAGFISLNKDNKPIFSFGKYKGQEVLNVFKKDPGYYGWILKSDFPMYTKKILTSIKLSNKEF